jgi:NitT/TauT family transport system substrate-binding protein
MTLVSRWGLLLVAVCSLLACGPGAAPAGSAPSSPPNPGGTPAPAVSGVAAAAQPTPTAPPQKILVTYPGEGLCCLPIFAARDRGFFAQNGLDAETVQMTSDRAMAAVASGELHYVGGVGTASVAAAALGLPVRAAWISASSPAYTIYARPDIKTPDQLRGTRMGVQGLGGTTAVVTDLALKHYGIDAGHDLILLQLPGDELRLEALRSGAIDAAAFNPPQTLTARREGFTPLIDVAALVQMPLGGLSISLEKINNDRDQAKRVIRALDQAQQWILNNREEAIQMIMEGLQVDRPTAEGTYDETMPTYQTKGLINREGIENILAAVREGGRVGPEVRFEDVADGRLAEEVARELGLIP